MESAVEMAIEVIVVLLCATAIVTVFFYLFMSMQQLGVMYGYYG